VIGEQVASTYARLSARRTGTLLVLTLAIAVSFVLDVATGPAFLSLSDVAGSILLQQQDRTVDAIVWALRLPIAVIAVLVGCSLGVTGALMQTILNNPLASSYTLGISAAAGFGAALAIVFGAALPVPETYAVPASSFAFATLACCIVWGIGRLRGATPEILILAGIALLFLFQALVSLVQFLASPEALQQIVFWLFGSLQRANWLKSAIIGIALVAVCPVIIADAWRLTALRLGDERARALGVDVNRLRLRIFASISVLTGVAVAFVGTIGFIGLVAPHIARMFVGEDQRGLLPASAGFGALLLSLASVLSKLVLPGTILPIGIVTAMIGVPFFFWLILRSRRSFW